MCFLRILYVEFSNKEFLEVCLELGMVDKGCISHYFRVFVIKSSNLYIFIDVKKLFHPKEVVFVIFCYIFDVYHICTMLNVICTVLNVIYAQNQVLLYQCNMSLLVRKLVFGVSHQVRHKPGCAATEDG